MKIVVVIALTVLAPLASASLKKSARVTFGPRNCIRLTRSAAGSCVLSTHCEGIDISKTEFAFDCVGHKHTKVRHSFGTGGFEASEHFDTGVKCLHCHRPSPLGANSRKALLKPVPVADAPPPPPAVKSVPTKVRVSNAHAKLSMFATHSSSTELKTATGADAKAKVFPKSITKGAQLKVDAVSYGPKGCVSTYKNKEGHCIMATKCKDVDISNYEFGVVCVDKTGSPVKHLFGKDSFDKVERFNTLIKCEQCLGLEDVPNDTRLFGEVATLSTGLSNLRDVVQNISTNVDMLNKEVFKAGPSAAPAPAPAIAEDTEHAASKPAALVHHAVRHRRHTDRITIVRASTKHSQEHLDHTTIVRAATKHNLRHARPKHDHHEVAAPTEHHHHEVSATAKHHHHEVAAPVESAKDKETEAQDAAWRQSASVGITAADAAMPRFTTDNYDDLD